MPRHRFAALALLAAAAAVGAARAGSYTIDPFFSGVPPGHAVTLTVSVDTRDFAALPGRPDGLLSVEIPLFLFRAPSAVTVTNFTLAPGLPAGSAFQSTDPATGAASVNLGANSLSSFDGPLYSFDFIPTKSGSYQFSGVDGLAEYASGADSLEINSDARVMLIGVPEPASATLAGAVLGALALRGRRKCFRAASAA